MKYCLLTIIGFLFSISAQANNVIKVLPGKGDMTKEIQAAIDGAVKKGNRSVTIELEEADYHLYRKSSTHKIYHISNTTSESENPDPTKHIALYLKDLKNVTIDGKGARLVLHGEMTSFALDGCRDIKLKNFTVSYADPTVVEMTVKEVGNNYMTVTLPPQTGYEIVNGVCTFKGESWAWSSAIAQTYDPKRDETWRSWSPLSSALKATELSRGVIRFDLQNKPNEVPGTVFQLRDSFRDETCGLIQNSSDVLLENIHFDFTGNFGIVAQVSENITYKNIVFEPEKSSGRTCSGFADFLQVSGCKGLILVEDSRFVGAQDDPINVHGTHLKIIAYPSTNQLKVRYMHNQTFGFQQFYPENEIDIVDPHTLIPVATCRVKEAKMDSNRDILITLTQELPENILQKKELVVENVTYTPEVIIRNNYFSRVPTRGILVTTRRKVIIENNTFFRMKMSGVHISDDARSWYESGMVRNVTIRGNKFIECGSPVVSVAPENDQNGGYVHSNIKVKNNNFILKGGLAVSAKSVDGLEISGNTFITKGSADENKLIRTSECNKVIIKDNKIESK